MSPLQFSWLRSVSNKHLNAAAMNAKLEVPESLYTYALATVGPYPARYDKILEEAFSAHKMLLGAYTLRQIAGGGSNTTAQDAVDRFRTKLHKSLATRIEFGTDIPAEVSTRMSAAMADLWTACVKVAASEFSQERDRLEQAVAQSAAREQDALVSSSTRGERIVELEHELRALNDAQISLQAEITRMRDVQLVSDAQNAQMQNSLEARQLDVTRLESLLDESKSLREADAFVHEADKETLKREFRSQISELKREQEVALERVLKERDAARNAEARERAVHAETTIKLARTEQRLSQATEQANATREALLLEQGVSALLRGEVAQLNTRIELLMHEIASKDDLAARSQEQLGLLQSIRQSLLDAQERSTTAEAAITTQGAAPK